MKFSAFGLSDIGLCRSKNEDVWAALLDLGFFALADGMGGHKGGEVAAREAIEHILGSMKSFVLPKNSLSMQPIDALILLKKAIEEANSWVYQMGKKTKSLKRMGTTLCCLLCLKDAVVYGHVGDSRIYRIRKKRVELLTHDHSLFAKWLAMKKQSSTPFPYKNIITRAIGTAPTIEPELAFSRLEKEDLFLLCSDGLSDVLSTEEIQKKMNENHSLEKTCQNLIEEAKFKGSSDNITLLLIQSDEDAKKYLLRSQCDHSS